MAYSSISQFVSSIGFTLITTEEEHKSTKRVTIKCPKQHDSSFAVDSLRNKKRLYNRGELKTFCSECIDIEKRRDLEQKTILEIKQNSGHTVVAINLSTREVEYDCGTCGERKTSFISNLKISKGYCRNCETWHHKLPYTTLKEKVEEMKVTLLTEEHEYTNNKMLLKIICICGNPDRKTLSDIRRGRGCSDFCRMEKVKNTCLERYGVTNVSKDPEIFSRIVSAIRTRKEYELPSGRVVNLQGYEPQAVDYLLSGEDKFLERKISERDLSFGIEIPSFRYVDEDGTERVYHPDIAIGDMIIEVKSDWTLHRWKETNIRKFQAVNEKGYKLRLLLFYENGEVQEDLLLKGEELRGMQFREKGRRFPTKTNVINLSIPS